MKELWFDPARVAIGGDWAATDRTLPVEDPSTGEVVAQIARGTGAEIDAAVTAAQKALAGEWGALDATDRGRLLARLGRLVEERAETLARIEAQDVGKPLKQARADALALARYLEFYAGAADKVMG